jgi:hypothetical protein
MFTTSELHRSIHSLRGKVFAHSCADLLKCAHQGNALAKAEKSFQAPTLDRQLNRKYDHCFEGVLLNSNSRASWCGRLPSLLEVERNPLWLVLRDLPSTHIDWAGEASEILLNGCSVHKYSVARHIWEYPSWLRLAYLAILLRSPTLHYFRHRADIAANFSTYFTLVCLQAPMNHVSSELYEIFNNFIQGGLFKANFRDWPADFDGFKKNMKFVHTGESMIAQRVSPGTSQADCLALMWLLLDPEWDEVSWSSSLPLRLQRKWRRITRDFGCDELVSPFWTSRMDRNLNDDGGSL